MGNQRDLKAFVRYDGSGRVVAGSLIFRRKKPTIGNFQEINSYKCCNFDQSTILVNITSEFPISYPNFSLTSGGGTSVYIYAYGDDISVADIYELMDYNNSKYGYLGTFKILSGDLVFTPNASTAAFFVAGGATSIEAYSFAD